MKARLTPSWELSTEHSASTYGQPVLVHRENGDAYGPWDIVRLSADVGVMLAAYAVHHLSRAARLDKDGHLLVARFTGILPP